MSPGKKRELAAVVYFFASMIFVLSFLSFDPSDPTIFNASTPSPSVHNILGLFGAHVAWVFYNFFGIASFFLPLILFALGMGKLVRVKSLQSIGSFASFLILALLFFTFLALPPLFWPEITLQGVNFPTCGQLGGIVTHFLVRTFSRTGAIIILSGALVISFIALSPWTIKEMFDNFRRGSYAIFLGFVNFAHTMFRKLVTFYMIGREKFSALILKRSVRNGHSQVNNGMVDSSLEVFEEFEEIPIADEVEVIEDDVRDSSLFSNEDEVLGYEEGGLEFIDSPGVSSPENNKKTEEACTADEKKDFVLPPLELLEKYNDRKGYNDIGLLEKKAEILTQKLADFGVRGEVVNILPGPVITMFEYVPAPGIKISKIVNLASDLTMALKALSIRIVAPIPGKAAVGIEIPNKNRELVSIRSIIESEEFRRARAPLSITLGKDTVGNPVVTDLARMPHLLIAGATGTGKSVCLNSILASLLFRNTPDKLRLLLIDPKRIELSFYEKIPHLIYPVVTDVKEATRALRWAVAEMEHRYELMAEMNARNIENYNKALTERDIPDEEKQYMPYLVIVIDELADLMMVSSRDVEESITRLAQMARAAGIHLILATQRPSVDVITGLIKANIPSRISFQVSSKVDSRTILDAPGAETLLGAGDMLFLPPGTAKLQRIHGAYISEKEVKRITDFWRNQAEIRGWEDRYISFNVEQNKIEVNGGEIDEKYKEAVELVLKTRQASISMLQRRLRVGYNRAARMIEMMEEQGIVGPSDGVKPREVLLPPPDDSTI